MSKIFTIDARLILQLGRDSIKNHTTALVELVKNSYDADATKVEVEIYKKDTKDKIRIADNGFGMTSTEIENNWLRIGFSEKRKSKVSLKKRRKTGEKGIGRIATDRLGSELTMVTKSKGDVAQGIKVHWDNFDVDNMTIEDILIEDIQNPTLNIPQQGEKESKTGTEIIINNLRQDWTEDNIKELYQELSYFAPLLNTKKEFEIQIFNDIDPTYSRKVETAIYDVAEIEVELLYDGKNELVYEYKNKLLPRLNKIETMLLSEFLTRNNFDTLKFGLVTVKLYFFPIKSSILSGTDFKLQDLKNFLEENRGVKIYRDNIAVKPYGFPNDDFGADWLGLAMRKAKDPAGIGRATYKITPNQLVGFVNVTRDGNPLIKDSASREGLVENEAFEDLKKLILGTIHLLENYRIEINQELNKDKSKVKKPTADEIKNKLSSINSELDSIKKYLEDNKDYRTKIITASFDKIEEVVEQTENTIEELLSEKRVLNALATLGISSAVFGHETQDAINNFKLAAKNVKDLINKKPPKIEEAKAELITAFEQAKLISGWGVFALARVEKTKRVLRDRKIRKIISETIKQIKPALDAISIDLDLKLTDVMAKTFPMDIESIILNLMTNAYSAVPNTNRHREIRVELKNEYLSNVKGFSISVADSGPGIAKEYLSKIWEPLWTTKFGSKDSRSGTGLGLTIVKSIVEELNGEITVTKDEVLKGANFKIWIPKQ